MADVFLSYDHSDKEAMKQLRADLKAVGITVWSDDRLRPGSPNWRKAVASQIEAAKCVVVILSPDAKDSHWVGNELAYASVYERPIFPVLVRGTERTAVPIDLITVQRVDIRSQRRSELNKLIEALKYDLKRESSRANQGELIGLTKRQGEVLVLFSQGETMKEIASRLGISPHTVRGHARNLFQKLGVTNQEQAVEKARQLGLLPSESN